MLNLKQLWTRKGEFSSRTRCHVHAEREAFQKRTRGAIRGYWHTAIPFETQPQGWQLPKHRGQEERQSFLLHPHIRCPSSVIVPSFPGSFPHLLSQP